MTSLHRICCCAEGGGPCGFCPNGVRDQMAFNISGIRNNEYSCSSPNAAEIGVNSFFAMDEVRTLVRGTSPIPSEPPVFDDKDYDVWLTPSFTPECSWWDVSPCLVGYERWYGLGGELYHAIDYRCWYGVFLREAGTIFTFFLEAGIYEEQWWPAIDEGDDEFYIHNWRPLPSIGLPISGPVYIPGQSTTPNCVGPFSATDTTPDDPNTDPCDNKFLYDLYNKSWTFRVPI